MLEEDAAVDGIGLSLESFCNGVVVVAAVGVVSVFESVVCVAGSVRLCLYVLSVEEFVFDSCKLALLSSIEARNFSFIWRILSLIIWPSNSFAINCFVSGVSFNDLPKDYWFRFVQMRIKCLITFLIFLNFPFDIAITPRKE